MDQGAFAKFLLVISLTSSLLTFRSTAQSGIFTCKSPAMCRAMVDYTAWQNTTLATIQALFGVKNHRSILGANNLPISTSPNYTLNETQTVRIPIPCSCLNNTTTGASYKQPIYIIQKGDGLYHIAADVFSGLVVDNEIAAVNGIVNMDLIEEGAKLYIPLPCSCDEVDGVKVVHYGHLVEQGTKLGVIAQNYGTTEDVLMRLNNVSDKDLIAGNVLDVPLRACDSSFIRSDSPDSPLLVANGTYVFTANNCVKCKCDAANNWTLRCEPSQIDAKPSTWTTCPSMQCNGTNLLSIGNATTSNGCTQTCSYAGYDTQTIFTTLINNGTSCASSGNGGNAPKSNARRIDMKGLSWTLVFICVQLAAVCLHLLH